MPTISVAPAYNPSLWHACLDHDKVTCTEGANCYAYALDNPNYHWAVPGHGFAVAEAGMYYAAFQEFFKEFSIAEVRQALFDGAARDGLIPIRKPEARHGYYVVALVFAPENSTDFHWYRQDQDGFWSHKNGCLTVGDRDDEGVRITDPRQAARHDYPVFAGYFLVPIGGVKLAKIFPNKQKRG